MNNFNKEYDTVKPRVILVFKRIYVAVFNIYSWYWLYRQIFIRHSTCLEDYLLWFFTTFGMYIFILEHQDIFIKNKKGKI
jgi:hypothetical protein